MKTLVAAAFAAAASLVAGPARAQLDGTPMTITITHAGAFSGVSALNNASYTYGNTTNYAVPNWGSLTMLSPAAAPAFGNAVNVDFTTFNYTGFTGMFATTGTIRLMNLSEAADLASVRILVNGADMTLGNGPATGGFQASWSTQAIFNANPAHPNITVAWNSVPAPGSLALLGLAGLVGRRRRRRA